MFAFKPTKFQLFSLLHLGIFLLYLFVVSRETLFLILVTVSFIPQVIVLVLVTVGLAYYTRSAKALVLLVTVPLTILLAVIVGARWLEYRNHTYEQTTGAENMQRAELIVTAVRSYQTVMGEFPETLPELVPYRLDAVPATVEGKMFRYSRDLDGFQISYPDKIIGKCYKEVQGNGTWQSCNFPL